MACENNALSAQAREGKASNLQSVCGEGGIVPFLRRFVFYFYARRSGRSTFILFFQLIYSGMFTTPASIALAIAEVDERKTFLLQHP